MALSIAVNALYLLPGGVGGTEIYLRSLLAAMVRIDRDNRWTIFANRETEAALVPGAPNFHFAPQPVNARNRPARILFEQFTLPRRIAADVIFNPGFTAPIAASTPQVTVFHDLQHKRHPEYFRWFDLPAWRALLWASVRRSRHIIAVSEATRADLIAYYKLAPDRVTVVPHGVDERMLAIASARKPEPMLLYVSTLHPHKNHERLLRAFARLRERHPEWKLVLAGMRGFHAAAVDREIARLGLGSAVTVTGWLEREQIYALFERAGAFVYPSLFEGFGMPVSESLAAGIPTACSDIEPLRTVAGGGAWLFDPADEDAMLAALEKLVRGERPGAAPKFESWESAARKTLDVLVRVASYKMSR